MFGSLFAEKKVSRAMMETITETDLSAEYLKCLGNLQKIEEFTMLAEARHDKKAVAKIEVSWDELPPGHKEEAVDVLRRLFEKVPGQAKITMSRIDQDMLSSENDFEYLSCLDIIDGESIKGRIVLKIRE